MLLLKTSVDDLVEFLDLSLDEAETILNAAKAVVAMRDSTAARGSVYTGVAPMKPNSMRTRVSWTKRLLKSRVSPQSRSNG